VARAKNGNAKQGPAASLKRRQAEPRLAPGRTLLRVAVTFFVIYAALYAAVWGISYGGHDGPVLEFTARLTGACANATGVAATVAGNDVILATRALRIDPDCTGITLVMIYAALVLAYPLNWKRKVLGLSLGVPVILVANLARLLGVAQLSGLLSDRPFLFVHDYLFKIVMMAVVIAAWAVYLSAARRHAS